MDKRKVLAGAVCVLSLVGGCVYYSNAQKQKDMETFAVSGITSSVEGTSESEQQSTASKQISMRRVWVHRLH